MKEAKRRNKMDLSFKTKLEQRNRRICGFREKRNNEKSCCEKRKGRMCECANLMIRKNITLKWYQHQ